VETSHRGSRQRVYSEEQVVRLRQLISARAWLTSVGLLNEMASSAPPISERSMRRSRAELELARGRLRDRAQVCQPGGKRDH
jgi:hypothetical protein